MSTDTAMTDDARAIHAQADASKTNLTEGVSAHVPGSEAVPPGTKKDPFGDRKALMAKADARRNAEAQRVQDDNPSVDAHVAAMYAAMGEAPPVPGTPPASPGPSAPQASPARNERATIQLNGRQVSVAQSDIDAAGGQDAYLRMRQLEEIEASLDAQAEAMRARQAELDTRDADLKRRQEEASRAQPVVQGGPATAGGTPAQDRNGPAASAESLEEDANRIVEQLFSGDPADAAKAIRQVLTEARQSRQTYTPEQVAELAAARVRETLPTQPTQPRTEAPRTQAPVTDPQWEKARVRINDMASREFPELTNDAGWAARTRDEMTRLFNLRENSDRRAVDVGREACQNMRQEMQRAHRIELKQGLPGTPSAGGAAPSPADPNDAIPTGSDYVRMMQDRRNFGPRSR